MSLTDPTSLYCTDEDLAARAGADFAAIVPRDQVLAKGVDGVIDDGDLWTITSATVDFADRGVAAGHVALLDRPGRKASSRDRLAVSSVSGSNVTLKRIGLDAGVGEPPSPASGLTGITFRVPYCTPQIRHASSELNRSYGVDELVTGRRYSDQYDPTQLTAVCVLWTLRDLYRAASRLTGNEAEDDLAAKAKLFDQELRDMLNRVEVLWRPAELGLTSSRRYGRVGR